MLKLIKNTKLYHKILDKIVYNNRMYNKYLDSRSNITEEQRQEKLEYYKRKEDIFDRLRLIVEEEEYDFKGINIPKSTYTDNLFKGNFRPDLTGKDFDTLTIN